MYVQSASATLTPQGRAIRNASIRFGDGETLPFRTCKKGYIPVVNGRHMYACYLHHKQREERVKKEGDSFRRGELDLCATFWKDDAADGSQNNKRRVASAQHVG
mmetsp:Transcript_19050/g.38366  ORF Transcript_19050/g.38366 Transcript_19050/m.38366 type:complete len:104 (-) Transcript_19050:260-571(-)